MGIVVLTVAILPMLGVGGMQLFKAEVPGPIDEKLTPRIKETAKILWGVYLLLTIIETALLKIGGMSLFDALCQTFGSLATGGFSTKNEGIIGFHNPFCEWVLIAFMFIGGTNFNLHYFFLRGNLKSYFRDHEFRFYLFIVLSFSLMILVVNNWNLFHLSLGAKIRHSLFQEVSIMTSTGYVSHDFELWNQTPQLLLLIVMFFGGMAGSTSGGIKMVRVFILYKQARLITRQMIHPRGVFPVRLGAKVIDDEILKQIGSFFLLYLTAFLLGSTILTLCKLDILSAISGTAACLNTCGPGLGSVGPMDNYSQVPALGKWTLSAIMLVGRLEIFTILILFSRSYWKH
jgi:trk system potassium uptake protein TrkH